MVSKASLRLCQLYRKKYILMGGFDYNLVPFFSDISIIKWYLSLDMQSVKYAFPIVKCVLKSVKTFAET